MGVHGDALSGAEVVLHVRADCNDVASELVSAYYRQRSADVAIEDVLIGPANSARPDANQDVVRAGLWLRRLAHDDLVPGLVVGSLHFTAPNVSPRTSDRCAIHPARITGAIAIVEAADIFAQKRPSLVWKLEMKTGSVPEWALVRFTANRNSFQAKMTERSTVAASPGAVNGSTTRVMIRKNRAPSRTAASRMSRGRSAKNERIIQITSGRLNAAESRMIPRRVAKKPTPLVNPEAG